MVNSNTAIIFSIVLLLISMGVFIPLIQKDFHVQINDPSEEDLLEGISSDDISALDIFFSILGMFTWSFGQLPFWLELCIFLPLRIILVVAIVLAVLHG